MKRILTTKIIVVLLFSRALWSQDAAQVSISKDLMARTGDLVTVPVSVSEVDGVEAIDFELSFDTTVLDVLEVRPGDVLADSTQFLANPDEERGRVLVGTFFLELTTLSAGTLIEIDFQVAENTPNSATLIDILDLGINEHAIEVDPAPVSGEDPTDGLLTIVTPVPDIGVNPSNIDFGGVIVEETATESVTISNVGEAPLELQAVTLTATSNPAFQLADPGVTIIAPLEMIVVEVTFSPTEEGAITGTIEISSDDPDSTLVEVTLSGEGLPLPGPEFLRGDSNGDTVANISDASYLLNWLFLGGADLPCLAAGDSNGDGDVNISDASYELNYLFLGGPILAPPFPQCGRSENEADEALGCISPPPCEN